MLMIIAVLVVLGLALGSFVNALVWRVYEQDKEFNKKKPSKSRLKDLSISKGRSMCPHCGHELAAKDLVPLFSWLYLRGKCRYCAKAISIQYPLVEMITALLFVASYIWWPANLHGMQDIIFGLWLVLVTGLMALLVYDLRWFLLPDRILFKLYAVGSLMAILSIISAISPGRVLINELLGVLVGGGIFYVLYQVSSGKWIGGGDVKLGWLLGLVAGTAGRAVLLIFLASLIGSLLSVVLMAGKRLNRKSTIPFGPFLIIGLIIVQLFGRDLLHWYQIAFFPHSF